MLGCERAASMAIDNWETREEEVKALFNQLTAGGILCLLAMPAGAQLLTEKSLSAAMAIAIAQTALETCTKEGYHVSVHVVGLNGEVLVAMRGDDAPPHTMENSERKAYTARTFRIPSGEFAQRVKENPTLSAVHLTGIIAAQGALPIKVGDEVIGAVGVSGAPGGEKDEACAKAGIEKIAGQLKSHFPQAGDPRKSAA
jgi:uncharacterized protein GlcG (DUF336 family)